MLFLYLRRGFCKSHSIGSENTKQAWFVYLMSACLERAALQFSALSSDVLKISFQAQVSDYAPLESWNDMRSHT